MALILSIETSTEVCSVALALDGKVLSLKSSSEGRHSELLTLMVEEIMSERNLSLKDLDAVAVSSGPGSYTGLRIGVSVAKGLCYALEKPFIAISTLKSVANNFLLQLPTDNYQLSTFLCPMIDARRMEVYCALFDLQLNEVSPVEARIIAEDSFDEHLRKHKIVFFGNGADKCKPVFEKNPNASFVEIALSAAGMISLAEEIFIKKDFENVALFEPFYLKEVAIGVKKS